MNAARSLLGLLLALGPGLADGSAASSRNFASDVKTTGTASYMASSLAGRRTASGRTFDPDARVAAHRTLPFGTRLRVTNLDNDREATVTVIDRLPKSENFLKELCTELKKKCGSGGTYVTTGADGLIEIQGDKRETIRGVLFKKGMTVKG